MFPDRSCSQSNSAPPSINQRANSREGRTRRSNNRGLTPLARPMPHCCARHPAWETMGPVHVQSGYTLRDKEEINE